MKEFNKIRYNAIHEIVEEILQAIKTKKDVNSCKKLLDLLQDESPDHEFLQRISSEKISDYPFMHLLYSQLLVCQRVCLQNTVCLICK